MELFIDPTAMEVFILVVAGIMLLLFGSMQIGLLRVPFTSPQTDDSAFPSVTVLVSARNEEKNLPSCIDALLKLDYPHSKLQIILVDDRSVDTTPAIVDEIAKKHNHVMALHTNDFDVPFLGKSRGLAVGFRHATGDWVAMTDADGAPNPLWLRHLMNEVSEDTGVIGGGLVVEADGLVSWIQRSIMGFVQMFNVGAYGLGIDISTIGSNMIIRRQIYVENGGFEKQMDGPHDDLQLHYMAIESGYKVKLFMDKQTSVRLKPLPSFFHIVSQQRRWLGGGLNQKGYKIPLLLAFWYGFFMGFFTCFGWLFSVEAWLLLVGIKTVLEASNMGIQGWRLKEPGMVSRYWAYALFTPGVFMLLPVSLLFNRTVTWRGNDFAVRYGGKG
jgi:cellulose synthase/poly-beta-1,6-N-acetylglucosamine synthase-like glycosyltransferase